ncbi:MAG: phosphatase PAP2 family protein [Bulleidia sp.]
MDLDFLLLLQEIRNRAGMAAERVMDGISLLSTISVFVLFLIYWCVDRKTGRFALMCFSLGQFMNQTCKAVFCVPRPWIRNPEIQPSRWAVESASGYSFPSGHSQTAMSSYGSLIVRKTGNRAWTFIFGVVILLVGFSRNYLGVHTPQDVLAGFGMGIISIGIVWFLDRHPQVLRGRVPLVSGLCLIFAATAFVLTKSYPGSVEQALLMQEDAMKAYGFLAGDLISVQLEKHIIFTTDGLTGKQRCQRALIGSVILAPVYFLGSSFLALFLPQMLSLWVCTAVSAVMGFTVIPLVFQKYEQKI